MKREKKEKPVSVLEGDEKFLQKILSRDSSVGRHSHVSLHYRSAGEVPFGWETMPGTPRNPSCTGENIRATNEEEYIDIRAVRPPPIEESAALPKPRVLSKKGDLALAQSCFWRKNIWKRSKKFHQENKINSAFDDNESFKFSNFYDADYRPSASNSSSSSSSSSSLPFADDHGTVNSSSSSNLKGLARKIVNWAF